MSDIIAMRETKGFPNTLGMIFCIKCMGHNRALAPFAIVHPYFHIGHLTKSGTNNGWHTTENCSRQLGCGEKEATQILHLIVYVNCLSLPLQQWGFDRAEITLPDKMPQTQCAINGTYN